MQSERIEVFGLFCSELGLKNNGPMPISTSDSENNQGVPSVSVANSEQPELNNVYTQLDGLRCFCVLGVLFQHFIAIQISHVFFTGLIGVDLFFIISGFLITENLIKLKEKHPFQKALKVFYIRRTLRIFPLYYFYWIIVIAFFYSTVRPQMLHGLLYLYNFYEINHEVPAITGHLWSLSVEEQFYLLWPFIVLLTPKTRLRPVIITLFAGATLFIISNFHKNWIVNSVHTISCSIALFTGAYLAALKTEKSKSLTNHLKFGPWILLPILAMAFVVNTLFRLHRGEPGLLILLRYLVCLAGFYIIGRIAIKPFTGAGGRLLSNHYLTRIGKISYGIYIYHYLVLVVLKPHVNALFDRFFSYSLFNNAPFVYLKYNPSLVQFPIYVITVLILAHFSYNLFEAKILKLKDRFK